MKPADRSVIRCAIYTRKSSEEGLEQEFNSLHAQREACEAYVKSQAGEGWQLIRDHYDDGGLSGGNMDRPGLRKLLADISSRRIDTVVVYKVDRLTRSLADFAKIVEVFDAQGVSFVSVTQQFNTTTSMGRLTLNMLLSFAQFEREVTGERIRDKIAASKQKGMWMGGAIPLGYRPNGRTLSIVEDEAETVRTLFRLYLEHRNVRLVKHEADRLGLTTKLRLSPNDRMRGGRSLSRGYLYKLLGNPLYVGRIVHKGTTYQGQHPPIVDQGTWDTVQALLANNCHERRSGINIKEPSLLVGKLFDDTGTPLTPTHAIKGERRYRYYVSRHLLDSTVEQPEPCQRGWRLPAREIERLAEKGVADLLADRSALAKAGRNAGIEAEAIPALLAAASRVTTGVLQLVDRVQLAADQVDLLVNLGRLTGDATPVVLHSVPVQIKRRGVEMRMVIEDDNDRTPPSSVDQGLIKALVRGHRWFDDLVSGKAATLKAIAEAEGVSDRYVAHLLPLAFLAPPIVEAILSGTQPPDLTVETLTKRIDLPLDWSEQEALLGFPQ